VRRSFLFLGAGLLAAASLALSASCGSSSMTESPAMPPDAAAVDGAAVDGGLLGDATSGFDSPGPVVHAATIVINGSPDLRDVRLCIGYQNGGWLQPNSLPIPAAQPMPDSNYAGIPPGGGVVLPALGAFGFAGPLTIDAINARTVAGGSDTCENLICQGGASCLVKNADYYELTATPPTPVADGVAYLVAIEGCLPNFFDDAGSVARCGAGYDPSTGNLNVVTADLPGLGASEQSTIGFQLAQLSPSLDSLLADAALSFQYGDLHPYPAAPYPGLAPDAAVLVGGIPSPEASTDFGNVGLTLSVADAALYTFSLAGITQESNPASLPVAYFAERNNYHFAVVGDVTSAAAQPTLPDGAPNPAYDGHGLHVVAFPTTVDAGSL
jgi:hypothetical protein